MNELAQKISSGQTVYGFWAMLPGTFGVELAADAGYDYIGVDQQHGLFGHGELMPVFQAIRAGGSTPIARVEKNDLTVINRVLDWGAAGVIVPLVNNVEEARAAAEACHYPPNGKRSYGPARAAGIVGSGDPTDLDESVLCLPMIETADGLENVEEIARTPGIDGLYIGPADLGLGIGVAPSFEIEDEKLLEAIRHIKKTCEDAGIIAAVHSEGAGQARKHAESGFRMITARSDHGLLTAGVPEQLAAAKGE